MRLYFVRHGETVWNAQGRYYGSSDIELSQAGMEQCLQLKQKMEKNSFHKIYTSPLKRTIKTARLLDVCSEHRITDKRLEEQNFGIWEGKTYKEIVEKDAKLMEAWNQNYNTFVPPQGESFEQVRMRTDAFLEEIKKEGKRDEDILIVAHKGSIGHMMAGLLGLPLEGYWNFVLEQGCYSRIDWEDGYAIIRFLNR